MGSYVSYTKIIYLFLFLILVSVYGIETTKYQYFFFICLVTVFFANVIYFGKLKINIDSRYDLFAIVFIVLWFYGLFLGIINEVNVTYVYSNFAGMSLFILYFIFKHFRLKKESLITVIFWAAFVNCLYSLTSPLLADFSRISYNGDMNSFRFYFSTGQFLIFPVISLILYKLLGYGFENKGIFKSNRIILFYFILFSISLVPLMSKGFYLSFFVLISVFSLIVMVDIFYKARFKYNGFFYMIVFILLCSIFIFNFYESIIFNLSLNQAGNFVRNEMSSMLIEEYNVLGHGLGSSLNSGYARDVNGYGFELSYHNLFHKLGIFSLFIFFIYIYLFFVALVRMIFKFDIVNSSLAFGCLLCLIPSYGNPILFSPTSVVMQVMAIYFLNRNLNRDIN